MPEPITQIPVSPEMAEELSADWSPPVQLKIEEGELTLRVADGWPSSDVMAQGRHGYVPAIPLPWQGVRVKCKCGETFWTSKAYRGHYALVHILGLD
jgi:hypothetical protein